MMPLWEATYGLGKRVGTPSIDTRQAVARFLNYVILIAC
jgi:hypothetical protein